MRGPGLPTTDCRIACCMCACLCYIVLYSLKLFVKANIIGVIVQLAVVTNPLLEEVCLPVQANVLHKIKWVLRVPNCWHPNLFEETIRHVLNVLGHLLRVHTDEVTGECVQDEPLLNFHGFPHNGVNGVHPRSIAQSLEEFHGKLLVETLITGNEFIREAQTWHETPLLQPENRTK